MMTQGQRRGVFELFRGINRAATHCDHHEGNAAN
jgi:hypothetical protein